MDLIAIIVLAIGLSMDSLAIALTSGAVIGNHRLVNVLKIAGMMAFMQTILTVAGWMFGSTFAHHIDQYDHWVAFVILAFLGVKMIVEAFKSRKNENKGEVSKSPFNPLNIKVMFTLALATSIDAMAVGLSLSLVDHPILYPAIIIGLVTFVMSIIGVVSGSKVGQRYNLKINIIGGIILIAIGSTILLEHTILASHDILSLL